MDLLKQNNIFLSKGENNYRPGVVHRLDRDTSGLIIFTKTDKAYTALKKQFFRRKVEKYIMPWFGEFQVQLQGKLINL